jgi:hypothetical protein
MQREREEETGEEIDNESRKRFRLAYEEAERRHATQLRMGAEDKALVAELWRRDDEIARVKLELQRTQRAFDDVRDWPLPNTQFDYADAVDERAQQQRKIETLETTLRKLERDRQRIISKHLRPRLVTQALNAGVWKLLLTFLATGFRRTGVSALKSMREISDATLHALDDILLPLWQDVLMAEITDDEKIYWLDAQGQLVPSRIREIDELTPVERRSPDTLWKRAVEYLVRRKGGSFLFGDSSDAVRYIGAWRGETVVVSVRDGVASMWRGRLEDPYRKFDRNRHVINTAVSANACFGVHFDFPLIFFTTNAKVGIYDFQNQRVTWSAQIDELSNYGNAAIRISHNAEACIVSAPVGDLFVNCGGRNIQRPELGSNATRKSFRPASYEVWTCVPLERSFVVVDTLLTNTREVALPRFQFSENTEVIWHSFKDFWFIARDNGYYHVCQCRVEYNQLELIRSTSAGYESPRMLAMSSNGEYVVFINNNALRRAGERISTLVLYDIGESRPFFGASNNRGYVIDPAGSNRVRFFYTDHRLVSAQIQCVVCEASVSEQEAIACPVCKNIPYCTTQCQERHWIAGGHGVACIEAKAQRRARKGKGLSFAKAREVLHHRSVAGGEK